MREVQTVANGALQHPAATEAPVVTVNQINLSGKQILAIFGGVCSAIVSLYGSGWLFRPAKDADLQALTQIVQKLQAESDKSINRLTVAIDNLSGLVAEIKNQKQRVIIQKSLR
jgi:hypothetical protein